MKRIMSIGLSAVHFHGRCQGQFARRSILQLVEANVDIGQFDDLAGAVLEILRGAQLHVFERDISHVELQRFGWPGWRFFGGLGFLLQQRVKIARAVSVLDDLNGWRIERDFVHLDLAADDAPQAVTQPDLVRLQERFGAGGFDGELAQDDLGKRAEGGVAHRDLGIQRLADARQDNAFEKRGAGGDEIGNNQENQKGAGYGQEFAAPRTALDRLRRFGCWVCHNSSQQSATLLRLDVRGNCSVCKCGEICRSNTDAHRSTRMAGAGQANRKWNIADTPRSRPRASAGICLACCQYLAG